MPKRKFVVLTDSACDLAPELEKESGVEILPFHILVDGRDYTERQDFTFDEYYDILRECEQVPATSQITSFRFTERFEAYAAEGVEQVLYVSINAGGSATNQNALQAREAFYQEHPGSAMKIAVVDSRSYSMVYGRRVVEAARKLKNGASLDEVVEWLEDIFAREEIVLAAYSLRFMKKSGRISAAAAFAGELLGLRPIITLIDGISKVQKKVRGDKDVVPAMVDYADAHMDDRMDYMVGGTDEARVQELAAACEKRWKVKPRHIFKLGAAVSTNTGPDAVAIVYTGPKR